jgi:hypothetical protein
MEKAAKLTEQESTGNMERLFGRFLLALLVVSAAAAACAEGGQPAYQRSRGGWQGGGGSYHGGSPNHHYPPNRQHGKHFGHGGKGYQPPQVSGGFFQRPYPYHLDYYRMRWGGSYAPYFGNLYGPPDVVLGAPYYGGAFPYGQGYPLPFESPPITEVPPMVAP